MTTSDVMCALEAAGTAQNRKVYERHGVRGPMFGVSYASLGTLRKTIGTDTALAESLWATGNHDARVLATMIADPKGLSAKTVDAWAKDLDSYVLTDAFSGVVARSRYARSRMQKWTASRSEWIGAAGWNVLTLLAMSDEKLEPEFLERFIETIETRIHSAKNRVRYAMNNALIAIGTRSTDLERKAVAAATRIGKVEVDHGATGCKTPDAVAYIPKAAAHRRAKGEKAPAQARRSTTKTPRAGA